MSNSIIGFILHTIGGGTIFLQSLEGVMLIESEYSPVIKVHSTAIEIQPLTKVCMLDDTGTRTQIMGADAQMCRDAVVEHYDSALPHPERVFLTDQWSWQASHLVDLCEVAEKIFDGALISSSDKREFTLRYIDSYAGVTDTQVYVAALGDNGLIGSLEQRTSVYVFDPDRPIGGLNLKFILDVHSRFPLDSNEDDEAVEIPEGTYEEVCERILSIYEDNGATIHKLGGQILVEIPDDLGDVIHGVEIHPVLNALRVVDSNSYGNKALSNDALLGHALDFSPIVE